MLPGLYDAISRILDLYFPQRCANYFSNCGYDVDRSKLPTDP